MRRLLPVAIVVAVLKSWTAASLPAASPVSDLLATAMKKYDNFVRIRQNEELIASEAQRGGSSGPMLGPRAAPAVQGGFRLLVASAPPIAAPPGSEAPRFAQLGGNVDTQMIYESMYDSQPLRSPSPFQMSVEESLERPLDRDEREVDALAGSADEAWADVERRTEEMRAESDIDRDTRDVARLARNVNAQLKRTPPTPAVLSLAASREIRRAEYSKENAAAKRAAAETGVAAAAGAAATGPEAAPPAELGENAAPKLRCRRSAAEK